MRKRLTRDGTTSVALQPPPPRRPGDATPPIAAPLGRLRGGDTPWCLPFAYIPSSFRKPSRGRRIVILPSIPPTPCFQDREHQKTSSWHPAGGSIDLREL